MGKILITGAAGQVGSELTLALIKKFGAENIIASDIKQVQFNNCEFYYLDVTDKDSLYKIVSNNNVETIFHMAAVLSAAAEKNFQRAWEVNVSALLNVLSLAKENKNIRIFWPSSIAVFGSTTPPINVPQHTITEPTTIYGITKLLGERLCEYYYKKWNVDVRSVRYPGLLSWKTPPGGGTTDYAIEMIISAIENKVYRCFLSPDRRLPMMYIEDAINATIQISFEDSKRIKERSSYNIYAFSFSPKEIYAEIKKYFPDFVVEYSPDFRDEIAKTWPISIDDTPAKNDWNWKPKYDFPTTVELLIKGFKIKKNVFSN